MQYIFLLITLAFFTFSGCSNRDINNTMAAMAGNKPIDLLYFTSPKKVDNWYFGGKGYEFKALPPKTYKKDWELMKGWSGAEDKDWTSM